MNKISPKDVFSTLYNQFGAQNWWPAETPFEVCIGAILTQNTAWSNVEKAIQSLKEENLLTEHEIAKANLAQIETAITPSGFYRQKAKRLKEFAEYVVKNYGNVEKMLIQPTGMLRRELLTLNGIGPETADSILLYAANKPIFVVDAYTKRIGSRIGWFDENSSYEEVQEFFTTNIKPNAKTYNEFHALIVKLAKDNCRKKPVCSKCPLNKKCKKIGVGWIGMK